MKKRTLIQKIVFISIFILLFNCISYLFLPSWKYIPNTSEGETDKYLGFYNVPSNNLDYLTLGVSHSFFSINPMQIFAETGIVGYNLGSPSQSIELSYYWLKEACKYQTPKIVFIDISSLLHNEKMMDAASVTKALLYMRFSPDKINAIMDCKTQEQNLFEFIFPLFQFHDRWKELTKNDWHKTSDKYFLNGAYLGFISSYLACKNEINLDEGTHFCMENNILLKSNAVPTISASNKNYFEKIVTFCNENNIKLIPIKAPSLNWSLQKNQIICDFLQPYDLDLWDLNSEENLVINWNMDTADNGYHTNYWGATKTSHIISEFLSSQNLSSSSNNEYWKRQLTEYIAWEMDCLNNNKFRSLDYLQKLTTYKDDFCIIFSVQDDAALSWNNHLEACIRELGLKGDFNANVQNSYIAVINDGVVCFEKWAESPIALNTIIDEFHNVFVFSGGFSYGSKSSIVVNNQEYSLNNRGLNIVIIDKKNKEVVSNVSIDSHDPSLWFNQKNLFESETPTWNNYKYVPIIPDGTYRISPYKEPDYFVGINNQLGDSRIELCREADLTDQIFEVKNINNGFVTLRSISMNKFVEVENENNIPGTHLTLDDHTGLATETWFIAKSPNNSYSLISLYNNLAWDISMENEVLNMDIQCQKDNGNENQQFIFTRVY